MQNIKSMLTKEFGMENITEFNIYSKVSDIRKLVKIWTPSKLTPQGKTNIIRSLLTSKIVLILSEQYTFKDIEEVNQAFYGALNPQEFDRIF